MSDERYALFVPFNPDPDGSWLLRRRVTPVGQFDSQTRAIQAAHDQVATLAPEQANSAVVMVQSEDGSWAPHDGDGSGIMELSASAFPSAI
ncbi:DUF2188 domain-containing protein [Oleiagrimonas sp. C23AA]|uniref:DUF2188 domain-containing protein n=1 Tax=Oleiagrimonas sp. C23AA TaxID=2719047 RepID=UPI0014249939|nr:DUF2188 domain-containing protein [Oleiagrimonas sp. C23AA]NII10378.1 hypothetical protein [Oleiagrimonas sp. C23AA]